MLMPSWKFTLNYETKWMTRDEIVKATYDGALGLLEHKEKYGVVGKRRASSIRDHLKWAIELSNKIQDPEDLDDVLRAEIFDLNTLDIVCDKHELDWPITGWKLKVPAVLKMLFTAAVQNIKLGGPCAPSLPRKPASR
jgi:hypothetical protein